MNQHDPMIAIIAARRIQALARAALDPACEDVCQDLPVTEIMAMADAIEDEALERLLRLDANLWKVAACVDGMEPTVVDIKATADPVILRRFENILPKVTELAKKLDRFKS